MCQSSAPVATTFVFTKGSISVGQLHLHDAEGMRIRAECSVRFCSEPFRNALIRLEEQVRESSNLSPGLEKKYARLQISTPGSQQQSPDYARDLHLLLRHQRQHLNPICLICSRRYAYALPNIED